MAVEHLFGTLEGQFWQLKLKLDTYVYEDTPEVVIASCILQNLAILSQEESMDFLDNDGDGGDMDDNVQYVFPPNRNSIVKRRDIMNTFE